MANIRVDVPNTIYNGSEVIFLSPCDCSKITGLSVYYPNESGKEANQTFVFKDAHGYELSDVDNLFTAHVYVKVILNVSEGIAYIQNADTNKYLESRFKELEEKSVIKAEDGSTYTFGIDDLGVYLEVTGGSSEPDPEEVQTIALLLTGLEDTGYYVEIEEETKNVENIVDESELTDGKYAIDMA